MYVIVFGKLVSDDPKELSSNPYERYIIVNSEDFPFLEMTKALAKVLHKKGKIEESEPVLVKKEDLDGWMAMCVFHSICPLDDNELHAGSPVWSAKSRRGARTR